MAPIAQPPLSHDLEDSLPQRQKEILRIIRDQGFVTIEALAHVFGVSDQTIRRDIIRLHDDGLVQRFHGGAGGMEQAIRLGYTEKQYLAPRGKDHIGMAVADMIPDGASVYLDVGTTVETVARALRSKRRLHVFTNSLNCGALLSDQPDTQVIVTGGVVHGADGSLVGDTVTTTLQTCKLDVAVIGVSGFDNDGSPLDFDLQKIGIKRIAMASARQSIIVADSSKFSRSAIVRIAPATDFSVVVTDAQPPAPLQDAFETAGLSVIVAEDGNSRDGIS